MPKNRRSTTQFNLSFLDVMCCGFGAVVLLVMLLNGDMVATRKELVTDLRSEVMRLELQSVIKKSNDKIDALDLERTEQQQANKLQRLWILSIAGALFSAMLISIILYRNNKNKQKMVSHKQIASKDRRILNETAGNIKYPDAIKCTLCSFVTIGILARRFWFLLLTLSKTGFILFPCRGKNA